MIIGINHSLKCKTFCGNEVIELVSEGSHKTPTWKLVCDPSGDFILDRLFRFVDIKTGLSGVWETGTRFQNTVTGKTIELYSPDKRKTRGRHSNSKNLYIKRLICNQ